MTEPNMESASINRQLYYMTLSKFQLVEMMKVRAGAMEKKVKYPYARSKPDLINILLELDRLEEEKKKKESEEGGGHVCQCAHHS